MQTMVTDSLDAVKSGLKSANNLTHQRGEVNEISARLNYRLSNSFWSKPEK